jgi:hypothetical protein
VGRESRSSRFLSLNHYAFFYVSLVFGFSGKFGPQYRYVILSMSMATQTSLHKTSGCTPHRFDIIIRVEPEVTRDVSACGNRYSGQVRNMEKQGVENWRFIG